MKTKEHDSVYAVIAAIATWGIGLLTIGVIDGFVVNIPDGFLLLASIVILLVGCWVGIQVDKID